MAVREGATKVDVYNSGNLVFLYDETNRDAINEAGPDILFGFRGEADLDDEKLQSLAQSGTLVVYELRQDDELSIEVVVGAPLSEAELSFGRWKEAQQARLNLPSGRLCIESYDSLRLGDDDPTDEGAIVEVAPGDYALSLHRLAWGEMHRSALADGYDGPYEILALTPAEQAAPIENPAAFLTFNWGAEDDE